MLFSISLSLFRFSLLQYDRAHRTIWGSYRQRRVLWCLILPLDHQDGPLFWPTQLSTITILFMILSRRDGKLSWSFVMLISCGTCCHSLFPTLSPTPTIGSVLLLKTRLEVAVPVMPRIPSKRSKQVRGNFTIKRGNRPYSFSGLEVNFSLHLQSFASKFFFH